MSTRTKGRNAEKEVAKMFKDLGYSVELTKMPSKFALSQDFFGAFDIICIKKPRTVSEYKDIVLIQVKSNTTAGALKKIKAWKTEHETTHIDCLVVVRYDNLPETKRFKIYNI